MNPLRGETAMGDARRLICGKEKITCVILIHRMRLHEVQQHFENPLELNANIVKYLVEAIHHAMKHSCYQYPLQFKNMVSQASH